MSKVDLNFNVNKLEEEKTTPKSTDISGGVRIQKKGPFKRFLSNLKKTDLRTAIEDGVDNVLLPDGEQLLVGFLEFVIESIFLGGDTPYYRGGGGVRRANGDIPYASMFKSGKKIANQIKDMGANKTALSYDEIIFDTYKDAQAVLDDMTDYIHDYKSVSILDLYSFIKDHIKNPEDVKDGAFTDDDYGWKDLTGVIPRPVRGGGYVLVLPKPRYIK